jgi:hypothetical protein
MTDERRAEIRKIVNRQLAYYVECDLSGGEQLMKKVREEMVNDEEQVAAESELQVVLDFLRGRIL